MSLQLEKTVSELKTANNQLQKDIEQKRKTGRYEKRIPRKRIS